MILVLGKLGKLQLNYRAQAMFLLWIVILLIYQSLSCYEAIKINAPEAVINAAAYTNVDKAETEGELVNISNASAQGYGTGMRN